LSALPKTAVLHNQKRNQTRITGHATLPLPSSEEVRQQAYNQFPVKEEEEEEELIPRLLEVEA